MDIPVYMIHNSMDPEDYFFIFDFEQFVERSKTGIFAYPALRLWAGRSDFNRRRFARQFRESFAQEFEAARSAMDAQGGGDRGWFGWRPSVGDLFNAQGDGVALILLFLAMSTGKRVLTGLFWPPWRRRRDRDALETAIEETQGQVDAALERVEIVLHMDLYRHAWRGERGGRLSGVDYDAWPLPQSVAQYLDIEGPECLPRA